MARRSEERAAFVTGGVRGTGEATAERLAEDGAEAAIEAPAAIRRRGLLLVLSSPSGAGKTTITRRLLERDPSLTLSVSVTTRPPRPGEVDGRDYRFIASEECARMVADGELLEHASVFGNSYGTPRLPIEAALAAGRDVVTDIDWQGTQQLSQAMPEDLVKVFVLPPSIETLRERLQRRAQDSPEIVAARMAKSAEEMSHWPEYDYVTVNRDIDESVAEVAAIVTAERRRRTRQLGLAEFVNRLRAG
jgi:guanylate kinase